jgi:ketosteroid isomerase-like protein
MRFPFLALLLVMTPALAAEPDAVMQTDRDFFVASLERGGDAWGEFAAEEARLPYGSGKAEIAAAMAKSYAKPGFRLSWRPDYGKVFGDVAVTSGPYELASEDRAETGRYVTVWRRQADGSWRFVWDGGTKDAD